jgi:diguanylate cyclase (GGDEF)-like protein/PAS domain S-box-containing protein
MKLPSDAELTASAEKQLLEHAKSDTSLSVADGHKLFHELRVQKIELEIQSEELRETKETSDAKLHLYTELFDFAPIAYLSLDLSSKVTKVNLRGASLLGLERVNLIGRQFLLYVTRQHRMMFSDFLAKVFETDGNHNCEILVKVGKHDLWLSLEVNMGITTTECLVSMVDITKQKKAEDELRMSITELERLFNLTGYMVCIASPRGYFLKVSPAFTETLGFSEKEFLAKPFVDFIHPDDKTVTEEQMEPLSRGMPIIKFPNRYICKDGSAKWFEWTARSFVNEGNIYAVAIDVTERKIAEEKLERSALYDVLTNLPNRVLLADRLSHAMVQCQRRDLSLAVAFMDLDGFKAVNDTYGHNVGDELLVALSRRMKEALREGDTLARIGGDEFIAVMVDLEKIEDSEQVLERLLKAAAEPVILGDAVIQVSVSIGVTFYPQDGVNEDKLMRHSDQAMYVAKLAGKNRYHLFDIAQDDAVNILRESISDIRLALLRREFMLHYQPKVNMRTGKVVGLEALIRWQHPDLGIVLPLDFLPAIEGHAISLELGEWVIDTALSQVSQWQGMGVNLPVSVNISAYQLQQADFIARLAVLLAAHGDVNPHSLELEILESSALRNISDVSETIAACHKLGVCFALDDFGTGYSSLTYLKRLPAYLIKIDQSFVRDMLEDDDDLAIIEGVVGLAKAFQREVIAEGVETIAHGVALLQLGCELAQGYGIARPMPADDIPEWASSWKVHKSWQAVDCQ